jgi:hypothetical protein
VIVTPPYRPRRVVTGHDTAGRSVVIEYSLAPILRTIPKEGVGFAEIWQTERSPTSINARVSAEPTDRDLTVPPPPSGTKIRINEFLPAFLNEHRLQSPIHRTETVDYGIVLEGEISRA